MSKPLVVFFQEILIGDLKKQKALSNSSKTGGGARDLRIPLKYGPYLNEFFLEENGSKRISTVICRDESGNSMNATLELWPPTKARPSELRIATIHNVDAWRITQSDEDQFTSDLERGEKWFYLLVKTSENVIGASILKAEHLENTEESIKLAIKERIEKTSKNTSVRGVFFYKNGKVYP